MAVFWARVCWPPRFSWRMCLMSSPVLIFTGHFTWHMPSAAHVSSPWYVKMLDRSVSLQTVIRPTLCTAKALQRSFSRSGWHPEAVPLQIHHV